MTIGEGIALLQKMSEMNRMPLPPLLVGVARAGSAQPKVVAGPPATLRTVDFGPPLHVLVVPADLHPVEAEYLERFAEQ
jgi:diphthine synthase